MNEMYIISVLMLYTLIVLVDVLLQAYQLFGTGLVEDRETIAPPPTSFMRLAASCAPTTKASTVAV